MRTLCLGIALVDLICEQPVSGLAEAPAFVPHFGGATANVSITAARLGASIALAGGTGDDEWGHWLRDGLAAEHIDLTWFPAVPGLQTPQDMVTVDAAGEPRYITYGAGIKDLLGATTPERLDEAVDTCDALFFGSSTLVGKEERALTHRARDRALKAGKPLVIDASLRLQRWRSAADAAARVNAVVPGALLVRANQYEAAMLTGERDVERAAVALLKAGAKHVVITLGAAGAILRGKLSATAPGVPAQVVSSVGAGDVLMGTLLARFALAGYYPPALAAALGEAVEAGARSTERWGALR